MLTLYVPTSQKFDAIGVWKDDAGRAHTDNIAFVSVDGWVDAGKGAEKLFTLGELCVAVEDKEAETLYLLYPDRASEIFKTKHTSRNTQQNRDRHIEKFGGFTCSGDFIYSYA